MSSAGTSSPNSLQPSTQPFDGKAENGKMKVIVEPYGSVVGEFVKVWNTRTGDFVRAHVPISYSDWRIAPQNFKDVVSTALMGEFEFNVPPSVARPLMEKSWSQKFRTYKNTLRSFLKNTNPVIVVPKGVDPNIWRKFVENEIQPKKKLQNKKNSKNRKMLKSSHCLGHRTCAQKQYMMKQKNPRKQIRRVDKWLAARERPDGTVLESAKSKYDEVKAAQNRRKRTIMTEEEINTCEDLDNDELVEVFRKDNKGRVRGMGSNISKKQIVHVRVTAATYAED